ncbi:hypothetical protein FHU38_000966 [Saccharomonospora amisosensis]|uniref:Phage gp6-like head-tail connector protein n=1 Tax=Saccharomonospora amisosensis TaxID=1128677 RepID=A0A7X5UMA1_9PSEU|nr:phage gp6-like head-tail connector protein [Saccharomonospora amisosensis]NIJ10622.1 hypothetical protein [Saccharomonospora amisosensis]
MVWQPDYVTVTELADYVHADEIVDGAELGLAVAAASRAVDRFTKRQFGQTDTAEERFYTPYWSERRGVWLVLTDDVAVAPTDVATSSDGVTFTVVASAVLLPRNAAAEQRPWTMLQLPATSAGIAVDGVRVTAQFGWTAVPDTVKQATLLQASRVFTRRDAPFGIAGSPDQGSEMRLLAKLDPDVQVMLADYRLRPVKVG